MDKLDFNKVSFPNSKLKGIIAMEMHSIAYTDRDIYVWGNNIGQFGNNFENITAVPTPVKV